MEVTLEENTMLSRHWRIWKSFTSGGSTFDAWNKTAMEEKKLLHQWCVDVINETLDENGESQNE